MHGGVWEAEGGYGMGAPVVLRKALPSGSRSLSGAPMGNASTRSPKGVPIFILRTPPSCEPDRLLSTGRARWRAWRQAR